MYGTVPYGTFFTGVIPDVSNIPVPYRTVPGKLKKNRIRYPIDLMTRN